MATARSAEQILDEEFLTVRAKLLEVAAAFDRFDRGSGDAGADPRHATLVEAAGLLMTRGPDRAERLQLLFSREYEPGWRSEMGVRAGDQG